MPCRHSEVLAMARQPRPATMRAIAPTVARVGRRRMLGTTRATSRPISINIISGSTHIRETRDRRRSSRPWFDPDMPSPHAAFMSVYRRGKATARSAGTPRSFWTLRPLVPAAKETKDVALRYQRICRWVSWTATLLQRPVRRLFDPRPQVPEDPVSDPLHSRLLLCQDPGRAP